MADDEEPDSHAGARRAINAVHVQLIPAIAGGRGEVMSEEIGNRRVTGALAWIRAKIASFEIKASTGQSWAGALEHLLEMRTDGEGDDVDEVLEKIEEWARRWSVRHADLKGQTAQAYAARARKLLNNYKAWLENPKGFAFDVAERKMRTPKPPAVEEVAPTPTFAPAASAGVAATSTERTSTFWLDDERTIKVTLPGPCTHAELQRFAWFVLAHATDFRPPVGYDGVSTPPVAHEPPRLKE